MHKKQNIITGYNVQTTYSKTRSNKHANTIFIVTTIDAMTGKTIQKRELSLKEIHYEQTVNCAVYRIDSTIEKMIPATYTNIINREEKRVQERLERINRLELIRTRQAALV